MAKIEPFIGLKNGWSPITENYATDMDNNLKTLGFFSKRVVESKSVSNPQTITASNGKAWIIGASPTGAWAGKQNQIAAYIESAWVYYVPTDGLNLYVSAENGFFVYKSTPTAGWVAVSTGGSGGSGGSGTINAGENLGAGKQVYAQVSGDKIQMRTFVAGDNVTLTETATEIKIDAVSSSQSGLSSAENIGSGEGVYAQVSGDKIQMKTLVAGDNIELTSSEDEITFKALSSGGVQHGENLGAGKQVYAQVVDDKIQMRTLVAGDNVTLTETATEIKIDSVPSTQNQNTGLIDIISVTGSNYVLSSADVGKCIETDRATDMLIFVTADEIDNIPIGATFLVRQMGVGKTTIAPQTDVTIRNPHGTLTLSKQYASVSLHKRGANDWCIEGNLAEV